MNWIVGITCSAYSSDLCSWRKLVLFQRWVSYWGLPGWGFLEGELEAKKAQPLGEVTALLCSYLLFFACEEESEIRGGMKQGKRKRKRKSLICF